MQIRVRINTDQYGLIAKHQGPINPIDPLLIRIDPLLIRHCSHRAFPGLKLAILENLDPF